MSLDSINIAVEKCSAWEGKRYRFGKRLCLAGVEGQTVILKINYYLIFEDEKEGFARIPSDMPDRCPAQV